MTEPTKCWRCLTAKWDRRLEDKDDKFKVINCNPHDCEGLEIKLRVPINICQACQYALKLKMEFECRVFRTKRRINKEIDYGDTYPKGG